MSLVLQVFGHKLDKFIFDLLIALYGNIRYLFTKVITTTITINFRGDRTIVLETFHSKLLRSCAGGAKSLRATKVIGIYPLGTMNIC